jgi:hypothetical protein
MKRFALATIFSLISNIPIHADPILTTFGSGTPQGSWAYSTAIAVGKGNSISYIPLKSDAIGLTFQGYVFYPGGTGWLNSSNAYFDEDTIRVFRTYVLSDTNMVLPLAAGIDDGHSIYVNDVFADGDPFGIGSAAIANLKAGVPTKIELLGYNGPGPSQFLIVRGDNFQPIESTSGLRINADGVFAAVPEPSTFIIFSVVLGAGLASFAKYRRRQN